MSQVEDVHAPIEVLSASDAVVLRCEMTAEEEVRIDPKTAIMLAHALLSAAGAALGSKEALQKAFEAVFRTPEGRAH